MKKLTVLLGAGFSFPAGMPLANDIRTRFDRDQKSKLLRMGSGEWMWEDEKDATTIHNGLLGVEQLAYSYILDEIIKTYNREVDDFDNYEVFFAFIMNKFNDMDWFKEVYKRAKTTLIADKPYLIGEPEAHAPYLYLFERDPYLEQLSQIINHLISDLLFVNSNKIDEAFREYQIFLEYIKQFDQVDIYTLNHDVLLEGLLQREGLNYSRGFTTTNSEIQYEDQPLKVFQNEFSEKIRIHKLHGSLDYFRFEHFEDRGKMFLQHTGKYNYFTTNSYRAKHYATRIDPKTKKVIQDMNFDITPKFITGTNKTDIIDNDIMYSQLLQNFKDSIGAAQTILISGYSYGDEHVNNELKKRKDLNIFNQNPFVDYPFEAATNRNLNNLDDLLEFI
ncbi:SIR2-like protein [Winogradskyella pacifica]|uniref:SIR2-like protein n=1 Tax=Winogradskyella pacifica TaxID=664642 RepID=A0A3D9N575_9FLAO|nr:SIR2 family protein [Winogradskyella pacifica]REE27253.1 SIR2-like protein [Winogradskyella pacifica]